jgi:ketosteroid isomerase-like protein
MSEENVEIVKRGHDAFNRHDVEAALEVAHPDLEWHPAFGEALLGASVYRGKDGFRRYYEQVNEVLEDFKVEPISFATFQDFVVLQSRISGRGRSSGMEIDTEMTIVWRFKDGQGIWGATYFDRAEALRKIGVREEELQEANGLSE